MHISQQRGISLIELLITIVITTVGLLGLSSLQLQANRATLDSGNRSQALWIIEDLSNRMRANLTGFSHYQTENYQCPTTKPKICSSYHNGSAKVTAPTDCSSSEQASSDLYESICPLAITGGQAIYSGPGDFISRPELNISIDTSNQRALISLSWDVRMGGVDDHGNAIYASTKDNLKQATLRDQLEREVQL